jgi:hypothetical protein
MDKPYSAQNPIDDFGQVFSDLKYSATVAATTDTTLTVPGSAPRYKAVIRAGADDEVWIALNAVADVPAGGTFAADTSELIPINGTLCREVKKSDVLHFYSTAGGNVSVVFYALFTNA